MARSMSLKTIADEAGASISTVSRAFARPEPIGDETRQNILAITEGHPYRPNRSARGLATGRTALLAVILPDIANWFSSPLICSVEDAAYDKGYSVLNTDEHPEREAELLGNRSGQADGVIACSPRSPRSPRWPRSPADVLTSVAARTPLVLVNRTTPGIASVTCGFGASWCKHLK